MSTSDSPTDRPLRLRAISSRGDRNRAYQASAATRRSAASACGIWRKRRGQQRPPGRATSRRARPRPPAPAGPSGSHIVADRRAAAGRSTARASRRRRRRHAGERRQHGPERRVEDVPGQLAGRVGRRGPGRPAPSIDGDVRLERIEVGRQAGRRAPERAADRQRLRVVAARRRRATAARSRRRRRRSSCRRASRGPTATSSGSRARVAGAADRPVELVQAADLRPCRRPRPVDDRADSSGASPGAAPTGRPGSRCARRRRRRPADGRAGGAAPAARRRAAASPRGSGATPRCRGRRGPSSVVAGPGGSRRQRSPGRRPTQPPRPAERRRRRAPA